MITKAIIKQLYTTEDNHFIIYIPLFRKAGWDEYSATLSATAVCIPGIENVYKVDDVVFVGFEDNNVSKPVILGKLFTGKENIENITTTLTVKSQEVLESVKLPSNTSIRNIDVSDLNNKVNYLLDNAKIE